MGAEEVGTAGVVGPVIEPAAEPDVGSGSRGRRVGSTVRIALVLVAVAYVAVRLQAVLRVQEVWGSMPDSAGYRAVGEGPATPLVSLTGDAQRPWTVPLVYALLPGDGARAGLQVVVSITAWLTLAGVVARQVRRPALSIAAALAILVLSCSWPVIIWDLAILSESLAISLGVLVVAAWLVHLRARTWWTAAAVVGATVLWQFTRLQHVPVVALTALVALVLVVRPTGRAVRLVTALGLVAATLWGVLALGPQDRAYAARDGYGVSLFGETFALNLRFTILPSADATRWFVDAGMPEPDGLEPRPRPAGIHDDAWETWPEFYERYRADTDLRRWVETEGRAAYSRYLVTHAPGEGARFASQVDEILVPPASSLGYAFPEPILPGPVAALVAPEAGRGWAVPTPLLLAAAIVVTIAVRRRAPPNRRLAAVGAATAIASVPGLFLAWSGSPVEYARHAVPYSTALTLGLVLVLVAAGDADAVDATGCGCARGRGLRLGGRRP